ncbi:hypothetical protein ET445_00775 [Agromyces protaetiae]|uniref:Transmembrane protein n=1 Tax=Agromyces protaetiae TaxID=2509455 RepID=A0A4V0YGR0_9MICO|nr:hypothetical protein [Agromyces protaetiae]QAY72081.1 hypothetical protein ET445_00775 [Agromyces protaetiae]
MTNTEVRVAAKASAWFASVVALAIAAVALIGIWNLALPVTAPGVVCAAIFPPTAGCAGDARILPAIVWSALVLIAAGAAFLLGRRGWLGALAGIVITAVVGGAGYYAVWALRPFILG